MSNNKRCTSNASWLDALEILLCTFFPFALPFILEIPEDIFTIKGKWILLVAGIVLVLGSLLFFQVRRKKVKSSTFKDKVARRAFSNAYSLMEKKKDNLAQKAYGTDFNIPRKYIPYDVHSYIGAICQEFRTTISDITGVEREQMSVSFIYRYVFRDANADDKQWRWIVGKESATSKELDEYVEDDRTVFHMLIYGTQADNGTKTSYASVFENDKRKLAAEGHYYMSTRDEQHDKIGSIFSAKIVFGNNANNFVESILTVASYGKRFVDSSNANEDTVSAQELEVIILENVLPYFQRLIESELGILYLRHIGKE